MFKLIWNRIYGSTPVTFESAYDLEESVRRLKAVTLSPPKSSLKEVMYGEVSDEHVSLRRLSAPENYLDDSILSSFFPRFNLEPYLYGSFQQTEQGLILVGKFSMSLREKIGIPIFCYFFLSGIYSGWFYLGHNYWWIILAVLAVLGILTSSYSLYYFAKKPPEDIPWLTKKISEALSALEKEASEK